MTRGSRPERWRAAGARPAIACHTRRCSSKTVTQTAATELDSGSHDKWGGAAGTARPVAHGDTAP